MDLPDVRYAGTNRFHIDDANPVSAYEALQWLEANGATPVQAQAALKQARQEAEES